MYICECMMFFCDDNKKMRAARLKILFTTN